MTLAPRLDGDGDVTWHHETPEEPRRVRGEEAGDMFAIQLGIVDEAESERHPNEWFIDRQVAIEAPTKAAKEGRFAATYDLAVREPRLNRDELAAWIAFLLEPIAKDEPRGDVVRVGVDRPRELLVPFRLAVTFPQTTKRRLETPGESFTVDEELDDLVALDEPLREIDVRSLLEDDRQRIGERACIMTGRELETPVCVELFEEVRQLGDQLVLVNHLEETAYQQRARFTSERAGC